MTEQEKIYSLVQGVANRVMLEPALVCALIEQESRFNPWLNRYEMGFENSERYGPVVRRDAAEFVKTATFWVSLETEVKNRCCSWGLMQVMGQTARELGFTGPMAKLCDVEVSLWYGTLLLSKKMAAFNHDVHNALLAYNGGGNKGYPDEVLARVEKYRMVFA